MTLLWLTLILLASSVILNANEAAPMVCAFSRKDNVKYRRLDSTHEDESGNPNSSSENFMYSNNTEHCAKDSDSCYALWQEDPINKSITILTQGCWDSSGDVSCESNDCVANKKPPKALNNTKFCCCSGNFCNVNVTDGYVYVPESPTAQSKPGLKIVNPGFTSAQLAILLIVFIAFTCLITAGLLAYRFYWSNHKRSSDSLHLMEAPPPPSPAFDLDSLSSQEIIGCGRYGSVYRGTLHDHNVAIKIFAHQNRQYFNNERDIYTLPHMDHPDLLKCIGSGERIGIDGRAEYLLVLSYAPVGCLHSFVSTNTFDWGRLCKMALSVTQGLAQLHTEIKKGDLLKPCIAHRDLTSRNILVKADGSCMLCDFGFAIRIAGSKYYQNGEEQVAETTSLADVGTLRYMAPEILEGAVNLRDCEASLKQIDVYALGLVLWEIATRCSDLFQGMEVPEYKLPFEAEIGIHPTMEQMQVLVTRHKARPLFPDIWKDTNPAVRALKETIEDCWDQDAEARLTTSCVKERLIELPVLWERHKAGLGVPGVSPTVNVTSNYQKTFSINQTCMAENSLISEMLNNGSDLQPCNRERIGSVSEATTVTLLSPSESLSQSSSIGNPMGNIKNSIANNSAHASRVSVPLQPHQGRNPCLERNLRIEPLDEVSISGNTLLEQSSTQSMNGRIVSFSDGDADMFDYSNLPDSTTSNYHISGNLLSHSSRVCIPIPYVQNAVHLASSIPKQPNVPGNGHSLRAKEASKAKENKRWGPFNFFDKRRYGKDSFRVGLKSLLDRKSHSETRVISEEQQPLKGFSTGNGYSPITPCPVDGKLGQTNPINCCWISEDSKESERLVDTEVRILKSDCSSTLVRPVNNSHVESKDECIKPMEKTTPYKSASLTKDNSDQDTNDSPALVDENKVPADKTKRPTSLPVQGYPNGFFEDKDSEENSDCGYGKLVLHNIVDNNPVVTMRRKGSNGKRKGVKRVKTPFEIKGRFSLYDDRIMSSQELPSSQDKMEQHPQWDGVTKFSASVPLGMNTLCSSQSSNSVQINQAHLSKLQQINKTNGLKLPMSRDQLQTVHSLCDI